jgi:RNA polymerase sigma-70 factor (ECF subfamily)
MIGSSIDAEDLVQETLAKALAAASRAKSVENVESWLFRIAHNTCIDFLRRRQRANGLVEPVESLDRDADPFFAMEDKEIVASSLRTFMRLPVAQRSSVILMDVLGYTLNEIAAIMEASVPAVKSALHRGRERLRELANEPEDAPHEPLSDHQRDLLQAYVDRFNARDFDAVRAMIAQEVHLDMVSKARMSGRRDVSQYFSNYASVSDWHLQPGTVEGRAAAFVYDDANAPTPSWFVLLEWSNDEVVFIRDFRYVRYVTDGADARPYRD